MRMLAALLTALTVATGVGLALDVVPRAHIRVREEPAVSARQQWLIQAGLHLTPAQFRLASVAAGAASFVVFLALTGVWTVAIVPAVLVGLFPRLYFGRARERRLLEVQRAWPDGLRDLIASVTAGMSLERSVVRLAETGPEPLRLAFSRFGFLAATIGVVTALEVIREELADPTSDRVIEVLMLAHERGGGIVPDILRDLADATTRDVWTMEEIQTESLEQKINARAVFALPWLVLIVITVQDGAFRDFYATTAGLAVILLGAGMSAFGMWLVSRLGRDAGEPRVFGGAAAERRMS